MRKPGSARWPCSSDDWKSSACWCCSPPRSGANDLLACPARSALSRRLLAGLLVRRRGRLLCGHLVEILAPRQHQFLRGHGEIDVLLRETPMDLQVDRLLNVHVPVEVGSRHEVDGFEFQ